MSGARIVVLGSINVDLGVRVHAFPDPGETVRGDDLSISPGGKGANQAVAAALAGAEVSLVGAVGADHLAEVALSGLRRAGVDVGQVREVEGVTGTALITIDEGGENTIIVSPGGNGFVDCEDADVACDLLGAAGILLLQGEIAPRVVDHACVRARSAPGCRIVLNAAPVTGVSPATLKAADPLVVNETEAHAIVERMRSGAGTEGGARHGGGTGSVRADSAQSTNADSTVSGLGMLASDIVEWGVPSVVLTLGARGSLVAERTSDGVVLRRVESASAEVVDTTGAGDMFVGALAARLLAGSDLTAAAREASVRAAATVRFRGAQPSYFEAEATRTCSGSSQFP